MENKAAQTQLEKILKGEIAVLKEIKIRQDREKRFQVAKRYGFGNKL